MYCTFEEPGHLPACEGAGAGVLAEAELHEEDGHADEQEHDDVGNEEHCAAVSVAQVREAPHVTQAHRIALLLQLNVIS